MTWSRAQKDELSIRFGLLWLVVSVMSLQASDGWISWIWAALTVLFAVDVWRAMRKVKQ